MKTKWGIIGTGKIAHKFAADLLLLENAELMAVASRDLEKAESFASQYGAKKYFGSYEELAKDPEVDIIYIATPHVFHFENTMLCLHNKKAVLCEKPFGINVQQAKAMIDLASQKRLFLMEALWTRFIPAFEKVLEIIESGEIGKVISIDANFGFKAEYNPKSRLFNKNLGGGSLLDIGIYPVYLALTLLGIPDEVNAKAEILNEIDASCSMTFNYKNGQQAKLFSTFLENTSTEALVKGAKGEIKIHKNFHHPEKVTVSLNSGATVDYEIKYQGNGYYHEIVEVTNCLLEGKVESSKISHSRSLELIEILDRVRKEIGLSY